MAQDLTLIDDGVFYIERSVNGIAATTNGFLLRRCNVGVTTPGGYECIGGYERQCVWNGLCCSKAFRYDVWNDTKLKAQ